MTGSHQVRTQHTFAAKCILLPTGLVLAALVGCLFVVNYAAEMLRDRRTDAWR